MKDAADVSQVEMWLVPETLTQVCLSSAELYEVEVSPVSEEKALKALDRVKLLRKLREEIMVHPELKSRLKKCESALDLPEWWVDGKHDRDLLYGISRSVLDMITF